MKFTLALLATFVALVAALPVDDSGTRSTTWYIDRDGHPTLTDPSLKGDELLPKRTVPDSSSIIGKWYRTTDGVVVRFDQDNGYVENGVLGGCNWPKGNKYYIGLTAVSGNTVFSAGGISQFSEGGASTGDLIVAGLVGGVEGVLTGTIPSGGSTSTSSQPVGATCDDIHDVQWHLSTLLTVSGDTLTITGNSAGNGVWNRVHEDQKVRGSLDGCDATTCNGWAWDPDATSITVHFYVDYPAGTGTFIGQVTADQPAPNEPAIGGAHRFTFQHGITDRAVNRAIYAYGLGKLSDGTSSNDNPLLGNSPRYIPAA